MITEEQLRGLEEGAEIYSFWPDNTLHKNTFEKIDDDIWVSFKNDHISYTEINTVLETGYLSALEAYQDAIERKQNEIDTAYVNLSKMKAEKSIFEKKLKEVT